MLVRGSLGAPTASYGCIFLPSVPVDTQTVVFVLPRMGSDLCIVLYKLL